MADAAPQYLVDPSGQTVEVHPDDVGHYSQLGYTPARPEQIAKFHAVDRASAPAQTAIAALEGAGRGLTFGGSTWLEKGLGVNPEDIAAREEANPIASGASEFAGALAPGLLSGGASAVGEGATAGLLRTAAELAPPSLLSRAAHGVAQAARGALPESSSLIGRIAQRAMPAAVGSSIEGAAYGLGHDVHEAALGDPNVTAERILTDMTLSGVLAGGLGTLLGVGVPTAASGLRKAHNAVLDTIYKHAPDHVASLSGAAPEDVQAIFSPLNRTAYASGEKSLGDIVGANVPKPEAPGEFVPGQPPAAPPEVAPFIDHPIQQAEDVAKYTKEMHEAWSRQEEAVDQLTRKQFNDLRPAEMQRLIARKVAQDTVPVEPVEWTLGNTRNKSLAAAESVPADPGYAYHAASPRQIKGIADNGIVPEGPVSEFHMRPDGAVSGAEVEQPILLRVSHDTGEFHADPSTGNVVSPNTVPPENIEAFGSDGKWHPVSDATMDATAQENAARLHSTYAPLQQGSDVLSRMRTTIDKIRAEPELYEPHFAGRLETFEKSLEKKLGGADPQEVWEALNDLKSKHLDPLIDYSHPAGERQRFTYSLLEDLRGNVKRALENQEVWGDAAARQARINSAYSELANSRKAARPVFTSKSVVRGSNRWTPDSAKVNTFLNRIGEVSNATKEAKMANYHASLRKFLDVVDESAQELGDKTFDRGDYESLLDRAEKSVQGAQTNAEVAQRAEQLKAVQDAERRTTGEKIKEREATIKDQMKEFKGTEKERLAKYAELEKEHGAAVKDRDKSIRERVAALEGRGKSGVGAMDLIGGLEGVSHPATIPFFAAYRFAKSAQNPARMIKVLSTLERLGNRTTAAIENHVDSFLGAKRIEPAQTKPLSSVIEPRGDVQVPAGASDRVSQYLHETATIQDLAEDPSAMHRAIETATAPLMEHAPETAMALGLTIQRAVSFLASKIPTHPSAGPMDARWRPSHIEMAPFERSLSVVNGGPKVVAQKMAEGSLTPDHVQALNIVYPTHAAQMKGLVTASGKLTHRNTGIASMLVGQPMTRNYTMGAIQANQAASAASKGQPQQPGQAGAPKGGKVLAGGAKNLTMAKSSMTPLQQSANRGEVR